MDTQPESILNHYFCDRQKYGVKQGYRINQRQGMGNCGLFDS